MSGNRMHGIRNVISQNGMILALSLLAVIPTTAHAGLVFGKSTKSPDQSNLVWQNLQQTQQARKLYSAGKLQECRSLLLELGSKNADLPSADILLVWFLLADGKLNEAKLGLERLASLAPAEPHLYLTLGQIALSERRLADASVHFEKSATMVLPNSWSEEAQVDFSVRVLESLSLVYELQRRWNSAKSTLAAVANLRPEKSGIQVRIARCCLYMNETEEAKQRLQKAENLGAAPSASLLLARLAFETGKPNLVTEALTTAVEQQPNSPQSLMWFAEWELLSGNQQRSRELLISALKNAANKTSARFIHGKLSMHERNYEKATASFQHVLDAQTADTESTLDRLEIECNLLLAKTASIFTKAETKTEESEQLLADAERLALEHSAQPMPLAILAWNYLLHERREDANSMLARSVELARTGVSSDHALLMAHFLITSEAAVDRERAEQMFDDLQARKYSEFLLRPLLTELQSPKAK